MAEVVARARGGDEVREARDLVGVPPGHDLGDGVGARDEVELDVVGIDRPQPLEGVGGVGDALAVHLEAAREEVRVVRRRKQRHGIAVLARRNALVLLEGGPTRRHEHHHVELQVVEGLLGGNEVAVVDGVEGAAHDAEAVRARRVGAQEGQVGTLDEPRWPMSLDCPHCQSPM